jgi:hypothetical protein
MEPVKRFSHALSRRATLTEATMRKSMNSLLLLAAVGAMGGLSALADHTAAENLPLAPSVSQVNHALSGRATQTLVPVPKVYREHGQIWQLAAPEVAAIVIGAKAAEPERYAAERFQKLIKQRYKQTLPIVTEDKDAAGVKQAFVLGQRSTNGRLDNLCSKHTIDLSESAPGPDGFVIECIEDSGCQVILVGGSTSRGVVFGQDALFDLMRADARGKVVFPNVSVRDWPSIAWRGRPHSVLQHHLVPGALDAYVRARMNFTDVRDNPNVKAGTYSEGRHALYAPRKASMGFPPGVPVDRPPVKRMIDESHRRGLFVYGTVSCGDRNANVDAVLGTFEELIELGVDGLWISFDDRGTGGKPLDIARAVLELGRRHGMTGRRIAVTPPTPDYTKIDTQFDRQLASVPGMADAQWMFTRVPCQADVEMAKRIGLRRLPGWWHNLVRLDGGFLHNGDVLCTFRADNKPAYVNLQSLSHGWGKPEYRNIRDAAKYTDCVLLWGVCNGWPEEYEVAAMGLWAWSPESHDWAALRDSIYRYLYGDGQVATAREFDDNLAELKSLFHMPAWEFQPNKGWPCRLKKAEDRPKALALIEQLETLSMTLSERAPAETSIDPARLETTYLEPMRATLVYARKMAMLEYPEDTLADLEDRMFRLIRQGDLAAAQRVLDDARPGVERQLARISDELKGLKGIDGYVAYWRERVGDVAPWQKLARLRRQAEKKQ